MTSTSTTFSLFLPLHPIHPRITIRNAKGLNPMNFLVLRFDSCQLRWSSGKSKRVFLVRASGDSLDSGGIIDGGAGDGKAGFFRKMVNASSLTEMVNALPPAMVVMKRNVGSKYAISLCIAFTLLVMVIRHIMLRRLHHNHQGSVADLVRRGQLRSGRRGISKPLKYEDPFNNPLVKVGKTNSTIEMFGKVYRLTPVTLSKEEQSVHQKRRSRAYQWKRPTVFLKEGDSIPPNVDPDTVRWIPANHPFATTISDIDEDMAQSNVYQKHGVPFRVRAEHEALQEKLQALQSEQKFNEVALNFDSIRDFETPCNSAKPQEEHEPGPTYQQSGQSTSKSDEEADSFDDRSSSNELKKHLPD